MVTPDMTIKSKTQTLTRTDKQILLHPLLLFSGRKVSECVYSHTHTHTHTHTHIEREKESERRQKTDKQKGRERGRDKGTS